jgi:hypothetical protein
VETYQRFRVTAVFVLAVGKRHKKLHCFGRHHRHVQFSKITPREPPTLQSWQKSSMKDESSNNI